MVTLCLAVWKDATVCTTVKPTPTKRAAAIIILKFRVQNCEMGLFDLLIFV